MTQPEPAEPQAAAGGAAATAASPDDAFVIRCACKTHIEEWDPRLYGMEATAAQAAALEQSLLAAAQREDFSLLWEGFCLATLLPAKGGQLRVLQGLEAANQRAAEVWEELQRRREAAGRAGQGGQVRGGPPLPACVALLAGRQPDVLRGVAWTGAALSAGL